MARWEPNAQGRLRAAAFELFAERGYEQTTVAEIAARAGLTERTFFRHFADKREVLFRGSEELTELLVAGVESAPETAGPWEAAGAGLMGLDGVFTRELARRRQAIIEATSELQERELVKLAALAETVAAALRGRGVGEAASELAGQTAIAVFRVIFARWLADPAQRPWAAHARECLDELRALIAPDQSSPVATGRSGSADHSLHEPG